MTDRTLSGHSGGMLAAFADASPSLPGISGAEARDAAAERPGFDQLYEQYFDFVWRSLRRLGVREAALDDAAQDVFVVVHKKLGAFEERSGIKTWLFGITLKVAATHRRTARRRDADELPGSVADLQSPTPHDVTARAEAVRLLHSLLDSLADERREVFVMMELEQMSAPEVAETLGVSSNTVYSRLRKARSEFESALARHRARSKRP